jgi:hypothetical protein
MSPNQRYAVTTLAVFAIVIAVIRILYVLHEHTWLAPYIPLLVAVVLIYVPVVIAKWNGESLSYLDRSRKQWSTSLKLALLVSAIILPPFLLLNHLWQMMVYGLSFHPRAVIGLAWVLVDQLFLVAIPEEIFFRGWLQSRFNRLYPAKWNIFGVRLGWAWLLTAVLFAIAHSLVTYEWWHFAIFFPALVFGWMREKTGTIVSSSLFHCFCNLTAYWIGFNYT